MIPASIARDMITFLPFGQDEQLEESLDVDDWADIAEFEAAQVDDGAAHPD